MSNSINTNYDFFPTVLKKLITLFRSMEHKQLLNWTDQLQGIPAYSNTPNVKFKMIEKKVKNPPSIKESSFKLLEIHPQLKKVHSNYLITKKYIWMKRAETDNLKGLTYFTELSARHHWSFNLWKPYFSLFSSFFI